MEIDDVAGALVCGGRGLASPSMRAISSGMLDSWLLQTTILLCRRGITVVLLTASVKKYPVLRPESPFFTGKSGFWVVGIGFGMARGGGKIG